jgi:hypothetical protein
MGPEYQLPQGEQHEREKDCQSDVPDQHAAPSCALPLLRSAFGFHLSPVWTHRDEGIRTLIQAQVDKRTTEALVHPNWSSGANRSACPVSLSDLA